MAARFAARAVLPKWRAANASALIPPVCNKLLHKGSLSIMGVGGPNSRTDFHIEPGAEFFWQHDGEVQLPIIEQGRRRLVCVGAGEIFLLPPGIPHSPQRSADSFGIVVERERRPDELDGLRWYTDFESCRDVLWERSFHCSDLGRDLAPVIQAFRSSHACRTGEPAGPADPQLAQDLETTAPAPLALRSWMAEHAATLAAGASLDPFEGVTTDLHVCVHGGPSHVARGACSADRWLCVLEGEAELYSQLSDEPVKMHAGGSLVVPPGTPLSLQLGRGGLVLSVGRSRWAEQGDE